MKEKITTLVDLSHAIGREDRQLAILAEGNTSAKLSPKQFAVKASGSCLATLTEADLTVCDTAKILALLDKKSLSDAAVEEALLDSRIDGQGKKPSTALPISTKRCRTGGPAQPHS